MIDNVLFYGKDVLVLHNRVFGAPLIVSFDYYRYHRTNIYPWSEQAARKHGFGFLCFLAQENHWWQTPEMSIAVAEALKECQSYKRVVCYGHSMGAFGALQFASSLGASAVFAMSPQVSIDPLKVPFEKRWANEAAQLNFINDNICEQAIPKESYLFYDPGFIEDRPHICAIRQSHDHIIPVRCPLSGHYQADYLIEMGLLSDILGEIGRGEFDVRSFQANRRKARMLSARYREAAAPIMEKRHNKTPVQRFRRMFRSIMIGTALR